MDEAGLADRSLVGFASPEVRENRTAPGTIAPLVPAASNAIIVLGMHRSGTSALAGMLHHLGVALGDDLMPATADNPRGYWEHRDIVAINDRLMTELGRAWHDVRPLPPMWENQDAAARARIAIEAVLQRDFAEAPVWGLKDP